MAKEPRFAGTFAAPLNVKQMATLRGNERFTMMAESLVRPRAVPPVPSGPF
jgi:hypothetical protein